MFPSRCFPPSLVPSARRCTRAALAVLCAAVLLAANTATQAQTGGASVRPARILSTKRFRDRGMHPATGRAGSASLSVRALLNKDGTTNVEMTTGVLDLQNPPPPGRIKKAQLKPLNEDGHTLYTRVYDNLNAGGYFATQVNDLHHLQQVQAQTNIDGIDRNRTNVVTVVETVKKRPDLAIANIKPGTGRVGVPLVITALVSETNGDVGATANCVLYADGVEIDRAGGIFLDAGSVVSVAFTHTFTTAGTKHMEARLEQVSPGDWDTTNNSTTGDIVITLPNDTLNYTAVLDDQDSTFTSAETHKQGDNDPNFGFLAEYGFSNDVINKSQSVSLDGIAYHHSTFPYDVAVSETGDNGTNNFSTTLNVPNNAGSFLFDIPGFLHFEQNNGFAADTGQNVSVFMSNLLFTLSASTVEEYTSVQYARFAGEVTYLSSSFDKYWYLDNGVRVDVSDFVFNSPPSTSTSGTRLPVGTQYSINLSVTSGVDDPETTEVNEATVFTASPVLNVLSTSGSFTFSNVCTGGSFGTFFNQDCEQITFSFTNKHGETSFNGAP